MAVTFSLEVFPPKDAQSSISLWRAINIYEQLKPLYISITCHSNGTTAGLTRELVEAISSRSAYPAIAPHLVCFGQQQQELVSLLDAYKSYGIGHLVALRGDSRQVTTPSDFSYASDLVRFVKQKYDFNIKVAGYPEGHPESPDQDSDLRFLKAKVDAGADVIITQFFFDPDVFLRYRDKVSSMGIKVPVVPGILPIINFKRLTSFAKNCQTSVPDFLHEMFAKSDLDATSQKLLAMNVMTHQVTKLNLNGVDHFHFYTLNELTLTMQTCHWIRAAL